MITPNNEFFEHPTVNPRYLKKNYPELYQYIKSTYTDISSISEALYLWRHNITTRPTCEVCGAPVKFYGIKKGYAKYCSYKCANNGSVELKKSICLQKYGVENVNQLKEVKEKAKKTCLQKYGVENPFQADECKEKSKKTCLQKYGCEFSAQNRDVVEKKNNTFRKNHPGYNSPLDLEKTKVNRDEYHHENVKKMHDEIIDVDIEKRLYICRCPHPDCELCIQKQYIIKPSAFFDRKRNNTEPCTRILPFNEDHNTGTSIGLFVRRILDNHNISYQTNKRDVIPPRELDIYIPGEKLSIECNGIYWHSHKDNKYHKDKWLSCKRQGIQLITLWEDWIKNKPDIVESIILSKLGIYQKRIGARLCEIREISPKTCNKFLDCNHIQGKTNSNIHLGLFHKGDLIGVMTFSKRRANMGVKETDNEYELSRFCTALHTQVIGGAEKLLKYFIKKYSPDQIYSFSSNDISNGNLYDKLGFESKGNNQSYWYVDPRNMKRYHRTSFTKRDIVKLGWRDQNDNSWTEQEVMTKKGFVIIYDSGQTKWVYKKREP